MALSRRVKALLAVSSLGVLGAPIVAEAAVTFTGSAVSQNFNSLQSSSSSSAAFPTPQGTITAIVGLASWDGSQVAGTGTTGNMALVADTGAGNTGAMYSYGAAADTDRALGSLASGTRIAAFGVQIVNNASDDIKAVSISFDAEHWRAASSTTTTALPNPQVLAFAYGVSGGGIDGTNYLASASMTALANLNAPSTAAPTTTTTPTSAAALDGNANKTAVSYTFDVSVPVGSSLFIRWTDTNDLGNDAGIAIDNFNFSAELVPEPGTLGLLALGSLAGLARRRRRQ